MIYHEPSRSLIMKLRDPERVTEHIPAHRARVKEYRGVPLTQVKLGLDEARVLRNLGIKAPSPIRYEYDWPSRYPSPFEHQIVTAEFFTLNRRAICLSDMGCVDATTEYLTPTGWKRIDQYDGEDVAQYHPDTGAIEFVTPTEYVKKPCPEMIRFKTSRGVDQLLSPEHRVLYINHAGKPAVMQAHEVERAHHANAYGWKGRIPTTFSTSERPGLDMTDAQLRLQVAVMADGHIPNASPRAVLRLKRERKIRRLAALLHEAGVPAKWKAEPSNGFTVVSFDAPRRTKEFDAYFWGATEHQLRVIADECLYWDGSHRKAGAGSFFSTSKASADFIQYAFAATGRTARITEDVRDGRNTCYTVHARAGGAPLYVCGTNAGRKSETVWREPSPDGYKYCFMVPSTFLLLRRNGCVFATGNTGKTLSAIWAADYLMDKGIVRKAAVLTPLSTMESVWTNEIHGHLMFKRKAIVVHGAADKRRKALNYDADFYIINHHGVKSNYKALAARNDIDLWIVDEAAVFRNPSADLYNHLFDLTQDAPMVWMMTGTPVPKAPTDAWALGKILKNPTLPKYFNGFKHETMIQVTPFKWAAKPGGYQRAYEVLQPGIRYKKEDCIDLPPVVFTHRDCELTKHQKKAYTDMHNELMATIGDTPVTAANAAVKLQKLLQIMVGVVYDDDGKHHEVPCNPRLEECNTLVEDANGKSIVFVPYTGALNMVAKFLRSKGHNVAVVDGSVSATKRREIFDAFQNGDELGVLVAHPQTTAHGLTLTRADTTIWYGPVFSLEMFEQANNRMNRPGQTMHMTVAMLTSSPMEREIYRVLEARGNLQASVLQMYKETFHA